MHPLAVTIGATEAAIIISFVGVLLGGATLFGRWSKTRTDAIKQAREDGEKEQKEENRIARLEDEIKVAREQRDRFGKYEVLVQTTATSVDKMREDMETLHESYKDLLRETRESNRLNRELLNRFMSGELAWRPQASPPGS